MKNLDVAHCQNALRFEQMSKCHVFVAGNSFSFSNLGCERKPVHLGNSWQNVAGASGR